MAGVIKFRYGQHPDMRVSKPEAGHQLGRRGTGSRSTESRQKLARESRLKPDGLDFKATFCFFQRTDGKVENSDRKSP